MKKIKIHSPGTVANLVCGFDILGMALQEPFDIMELELLEEPVVIMQNDDEFDLPVEPTRNVAGVPKYGALSGLTPCGVFNP